MTIDPLTAFTEVLRAFASRRSCDRAIESEDVRVGYFWALSRSHPGASTLG
ncbi:MAG: hypothetical protein ICV80_18485 [Microcoleus sp. T1-bin1]|uniref:hypothetical protein n=1 Tax=Microcoleus sp. AR_TQ3_B6 TaxID=3055284 RepID=UPI0019C70FAA|nr:hypothetical protein [Microcoleus sp. T1-bin1]